MAPAGDLRPLVAHAFVAAVCVLLTGPGESAICTAVQAAVQARPRLQPRLVHLVLMQHLPAVAQMLTGGRQHSLLTMENGWQQLSSISQILCAPCLHQATCQLLQRGEGRTALLHAVAELAERLPAQRRDDVGLPFFCGVWLAPCNLLALLIRAAGWAAQRGPQRQAAWAAIRLLPRLAEALHGLAADPSVELVPLVWAFADIAVKPDDPIELRRGVPAVGSSEQLQVGVFPGIGCPA